MLEARRAGGNLRPVLKGRSARFRLNPCSLWPHGFSGQKRKNASESHPMHFLFMDSAPGCAHAVSHSGALLRRSVQGAGLCCRPAFTRFLAVGRRFRPITATFAGGAAEVDRLRGQAEERRNRGVIRNAPISDGTERTGIKPEREFPSAPEAKSTQTVPPCRCALSSMGRNCRPISKRVGTISGSFPGRSFSWSPA